LKRLDPNENGRKFEHRRVLKPFFGVLADSDQSRSFSRFVHQYWPEQVLLHTLEPDRPKEQIAITETTWRDVPFCKNGYVSACFV
jgi:hypothetical protein